MLLFYWQVPRLQQKFCTHLLFAYKRENFTYMNFDFSKQEYNKLAIKEKTQTNIVRYDEITYLECNGNLVFVFHTKNRAPYSYSKPLIEIECELADFGFLRINHNKLVNMQHVLNLNSKKHEMTLANEITLSVSRRKWQKIKEFFNS